MVNVGRVIRRLAVGDDHARAVRRLEAARAAIGGEDATVNTTLLRSIHDAN